MNRTPRTRTARAAAAGAGPRADAAPATEPAHDEAAARVLRQFRQIVNAVKAHFQQVERRVGLGGSQVWALAIVREQPGVGVTGLARAMNIRQATASNLVKALVERQLLDTAPSPTDGRAVCLRVTPAGARLLRKVPGPYAGVLPDALRRLERPALRRLERDLALLIAQLEVDPRAAEVPLADM
jgi:DNA-binding MarR family transcriptional regulator